VLLKPFLTANNTKRVLHRHAVCSDHAVRVDVHDVDVVKGPHKVGARDDLPGFVKWDLGEDELVGIAFIFFALDEGAG
jgi:hypothetical protein